MAKGWKKIKTMIKTKNFGDVKKKELMNYVKIEGYKLIEGSKHTKVYTQSGARLSWIPRKPIVRVDQLKNILKQIGRL